MKQFFPLFLFLAFKVNGQSPLDTKLYLQSNQVSKTAKDFYNGKFKAADDAKTFSIIDSLKTINNFTRPFYMLLVSKMITKADGALSESLGASCKDFVELHPDFLIDFLVSKSTIVDKSFLDKWAKQIAGAFMIDCEGKEKQCIKQSLQKALTKGRLDNKLKLIDFYQKIQSYCHT